LFLNYVVNGLSAFDQLSTSLRTEQFDFGKLILVILLSCLTTGCIIDI